MVIYSNANIVFNLVQFIAYLIVLAISQNDHMRFLLVLPPLNVCNGHPRLQKTFSGVT